MSFERLDAGGNNKFPLTNYGASSLQELAQYGAAVGCDTQDIKKIEIILQDGKDVLATEYGTSVVSVIPAGHIVTNVAVDAVETFSGAIEVGIADKADGLNPDADAIYVGTPTVGTSESAGPTALGAAVEVLTKDVFVTVDTAATTAGKAKMTITYRVATADIL